MPTATFIKKPIAHAAAAALIERQPVLVRSVFERLPTDLKGLAFTVTGVEDFDTLQELRKRMAELPAGADWNAVKKDVVKDLTPWLNPTAAEKRAETLMRLHAFRGYAATQAQVHDELTEAGIFTHKQYISTGDAKVRPRHAALDGVTLPANHPFWDKHTPPWEWNCRCDVVLMSPEDVAEEQSRDQQRPPHSQRVLREADQAALAEGHMRRGELGQMVDTRIPSERSGNGTDIVARDFGLDYNQLAQRWDAQTKAEFERWSAQHEIADGVSLLGWFRGERP